MSKYVQFHTKAWDDKKFRELSAEAEFIFIYLFTNDKTNLCGIFEIELAETRVAKKLGDRFEAAFQEIIKSGMALWDEKTETIFLLNHFKLIPHKSAKVIIGAIDEINEINHPFKDVFIKKYSEDIKEFRWRLKGEKVSKEDITTEDFVLSSSKVFTSKSSLKHFMINRGVAEQKIDEIIQRVLPNFK